MAEKTALKPRQRELDLLRMAAFFTVAGLHVISSIWSVLPLWTPQWLIATLLRATWAVPVFVMISGRFLLDPERQPRLARYAARVLTALIFWGLIYQLYYLAADWENYNWRRFGAGIVTGAYHMWYLWMLLGLYLLTPILRKIASDRKLTAYFLLLHIFWQGGTWLAGLLPIGGSTATTVLNHLDLSPVGGFSGYFLLGFQLHRWQPNRMQKRRLYAMALLAWGISLAGNLLITYKTGINSEYFTSYQSPLLMVSAAAVFVLFEKDLASARWRPWAEKLAAFAGHYGFGAYLAHALVNEWAGKVFADALMTAPWVWIPVVTMLVAAGSYGAAWLLSRLPKFGKYIA